MKIVNLSIHLYQFNELNDIAKNKAIEEHSIFLAENKAEFDCINKDYTIENIKANEYYFYASGELAHTLTYTNTGQTYFIHENKEHLIS